MKTIWFYFLFVAIYSCQISNKNDITGYWKLADMRNIGVPTSRDSMFYETVKEGTYSIDIVLKEDSTYLSRTMMAGYVTNNETGKYSLSGDGKYLYLRSSPGKASDNSAIVVASITKDSLKLKFTEKHISVFAREKKKNWAEE